MSYCPQFWGSRVIYMFERYDQKLVIWCFMAIFVSYCQQFWGSRAIYMFESYDEKLIFLRFVDVFMSYSPWFCGSSAIYNDHSTRYMFEGMTKISSFSCFIVI